MNNQILVTLERKLEEISASYGGVGADVKLNATKETLQYYVLNFIYNHQEYHNWIMYGGSALRICHGLDRMSIDLDFEIAHEITNDFLDKLKEEIIMHFKDAYGVDSDFLTIKTTNSRGLTLKFHIAEELGLIFGSNQVHIKIDLNHFVARPKIMIERWAQNKYQLSFVIKTYNMSVLMASKIAAIFLRGERGVGKAIYNEKGRDIYDLLWYMGKKTVPDIEYLNAKNVKEAKDIRTLFDKLTIKMNDASDENLKNDLTPLFGNQTYIENWLKNWRESYLRLLEEYKIHMITTVEEVRVLRDIPVNVFNFVYWYKIEDGNPVSIMYSISDDWIKFDGGSLSIKVSEKIKEVFKLNENGLINNPQLQDKLMQYAELFYQKTEKYLKEVNRIMLGDSIITKLIRMTATEFNRKEQILLNKHALLSSELEDLLK